MAYTITNECIGCGACLKLCPAGAITGEKEQLHIINKEFCIECGTCGRICANKSVEDAFGILCTRVKRKEWKKPVFNAALCTACRTCVDTCPTGCIGLSSAIVKKDPREYPFLEDPKLCVSCGFCEADCPVVAITLELPEKEAQAAA